MTLRPPAGCQFCSLHNDADGFCSELTAAELHELNSESRLVAVKQRATIRAETLKKWPVLAVANGVLSLQHLLNDGRRTIAALFMRGDILDLRHCPARDIGNLVALSNVTLCHLSPRVFDRIVETNTRARVLVWNSVNNLTFRAMSHASDLAKKQAIEKLASFIFECRNRAEKRKRTDRVEIPIRRRDLADYLGMQPETVSRCFKELEERGVIEVSNLSLVCLKDVPALRRIGNGDREAPSTEGYPPPDYKILVAGS